MQEYQIIQIENCASNFNDHQHQRQHEDSRNNNNCRYSLNTKYGYFKIEMNVTDEYNNSKDSASNNENSDLTMKKFNSSAINTDDGDGNSNGTYNNNNLSYHIEQYIYTHRYYSRAIVNLVIIKRDNYRGNLFLR